MSPPPGRMSASIDVERLGDLALDGGQHERHAAREPDHVDVLAGEGEGLPLSGSTVARDADQRSSTHGLHGSRRAARGSSTPASRGTGSAMAFPRQVTGIPRLSETHELREDVVYARRGRRPAALRPLPAADASTGPAPAVVFVHGGALGARRPEPGGGQRAPLRAPRHRDGLDLVPARPRASLPRAARRRAARAPLGARARGRARHRSRAHRAPRALGRRASRDARARRARRARARAGPAGGAGATSPRTCAP